MTLVKTMTAGLDDGGPKDEVVVEAGDLGTQRRFHWHWFQDPHRRTSMMSKGGVGARADAK